jgi:hypothetical protein
MLIMAVGLIVFVIYLYFFIGIPKILQVISNINSTQYAFYYTPKDSKTQTLQPRV